MASLPVVFRRIYGDAWMYRLEIGFRFQPPRVRTATLDYACQVAMEAASTLAWIRGQPDRPAPLADFGHVLAMHLTTATKLHSDSAVRGGFAIGDASVVVELPGGRFFSPPRPQSAARWITVGNVPTLCWAITRGRHGVTAKQMLRQNAEQRLLRQIVGRVHSDLTIAEAVLSRCDNGSLAIDSPAVQKCLKQVLRRLNRSDDNGYDRTAVMRQRLVVSADMALANYGDMIDRLSEAEHDTAAIRRARMIGTQLGKWHGGIHIDVKGALVAKHHSRDTNVSGQGNIVNSINTTTGNITNMQRTDAGPGLLELAQQLVTVVATLRGQVPDDQADAAQDAADAVVRESTEPEPDTGAIGRRLRVIAAVAGLATTAGNAVGAAVSSVRQHLGL
ncbi:hypothetical protein ACGF0D_40050 [Kitasatospora sp. NPDC048298]|uniref:hypothetical protein n=1 Tax=Kitasatospora sp. NPDC048298 TaxID=3364049 RepID=UPI003716BB05